jgi:hypothetical protein
VITSGLLQEVMAAAPETRRATAIIILEEMFMYE